MSAFENRDYADGYRDGTRFAEVTITRLRAENEKLGRDYDTARDAHDRLLADNERLRAVLELFACDCKGEELCLNTDNCRNFIAQAGLEGKA